MSPISTYLRGWIKDLDLYTPGETREGYIKLASNENNYGPSPKVIKAIRDNAGSVYKYPYRDAELKQRIAEYCGCGAENVIAGNGSDELIDMMVKTFKGPVVSVYPTYSEYKLTAEALNERYYGINLEPGFYFSVERFEKDKRFEKSNIVILCSPNNPNGGVIGREDIEQILNSGKITVIDEAYVEFYGNSIASLISEYDNLAVLRTFAKAFGLAGLRVGYALSGEEIIGYLGKVKPPFNVNSLAQEAAVAALDDVEYMRGCVDRIMRGKRILEKKLIAKGFKTFKSEADFILVDVSPEMSADGFFKIMLSNGIIVRRFDGFEGFDGEYVRISIGTEEENKILFRALKTL